MKKIAIVLVPVFLVTFISFNAKSQDKENSEPVWGSNENVTQTILQNTRSLREKLLDDPYRPAYHFCVPEDNGTPGDPNGAFFKDGIYHLMYLYNRAGSGFSWGHISSKDLIHWRQHSDGIGVGPNDEGCFSGGGFVDDDGSVYLSYWMLWGGIGIGIAKSTDAINFKKYDINPIIKSTEWGITETTDKNGEKLIYGSADPSNIWKKDGKYYMLTGNLLALRKYGSRGKGLPANRDEPELPKDSVKYQGDWLDLFVSADLKKWDYVHRFYESKREWTKKTEDNMCPSFFPLPTNPEGGKISDKHLLLFISHNKGCQYYIGDYKKDMFFPEIHGRMTWVDNSYFAPEALVDDKGRQIMWSWIFDDRPEEVKTASGWSGTYGLPRSLWLRKDGTLGITPIKEIEQLRMHEKTKNNIRISAGKDVKMDEFSHELMELEITFRPNNAERFGIKLCQSDNGQEETIIYYDNSDKKLKFDTQKSSLGYGKKVIEAAPLIVKSNESVVMRIFVDRSIVEVFANGRQAIARSVYPTLGGTGISLFSEGGDVEIESFKTWEIFPSNPY